MQSCKKRKTLHDPEMFIPNFTQLIFKNLPQKWAYKVKNYGTTKKSLHELNILHSFQKSYTILDRVDCRFLQLCFYFFHICIGVK